MSCIFLVVYNSHIVHVICQHSFIAKVSLQPDLRSKVQHLQRDLHLEVQHLMMLCMCGVPFCYFTFEFIVVNPDVVLGQIFQQ